MQWALEPVAAGLGGTVIGGGDAVVTRVVTDSRTVQPGDLFVAIDGDRFDGHDFAAGAIGAGAVAAVVKRGVSEVRPRVEVDDTVAALRDLAAMRRSELTIPVIAITGSSGKTSTKDLLAAALPGSWASPRSFNNEVGVPLTVLSTPERARFLVAEVGSRGVGHIRYLLSALRPNIVVFTNLGVVHLETFGTTERLADAKWELAEGLESGGTVVIPHDEPRLQRPHPGRTVLFGVDPGADIAISDLVLDDIGRPSFTITTPVGKRRLTLAMAGAHQAVNAAAATGAALAVGVDLDTIVAGLSTAVASPWRMEIHRGSYTVVNDAYNANPDSVEAAMRTIARMPGRHIAVLGMMAELGPIAAAEHRRVGELAVELGFEAVITIGPEPGIAAGAGSRGVNVDDMAAAHQAVRDIVAAGDVVLVKASRSVGLEVLAEALVEEAPA